MTKRTVVTSAAGEEIEIIPDSEWNQLVGDESGRSIRAWYGVKPLIVRRLWLHGTVEDEHGGATSKLQAWIKHDNEGNPSADVTSPISNLMNASSNMLAFDRKIRGKRCYSIRLAALPETWYRKLQIDLKVNNLNGHASKPPVEEFPAIEVTPAPVEVDRTTDAFDDSLMPTETIEETGPVLDVQIASQVAMQLLTTVVEIISAGTPEQANHEVRRLQSELETVGGRLAQRLEENERHRKTIRELGEELQAVRYERDGLRQRLRNTESNLTAALKGDSARAVTAEVQRQIDSIMRQPPQPGPANKERS